MPNSDHYARLCGGAASWNAWRVNNPEIAPELDGLELPVAARRLGLADGGPVNFSSSNLAGANLAYATLTEADFSNANLSGADFRETDLNRARFCGADAGGVRFDGAVVRGANFADALNLTQAQIDAAQGDETTTLPDGLTRPQAWLADGPDLYRVLGVDRAATKREIKQAYWGLAKRGHPDRGASPAETEQFKTVASALPVILNVRTRNAYDRGDIDIAGQVTESGAARARTVRLARKFAVYFTVPLAVCVAAIFALELGAESMRHDGARSLSWWRLPALTREIRSLPADRAEGAAVAAAATAADDPALAFEAERPQTVQMARLPDAAVVEPPPQDLGLHDDPEALAVETTTESSSMETSSLGDRLPPVVVVAPKLSRAMPSGKAARSRRSPVRQAASAGGARGAQTRPNTVKAGVAESAIPFSRAPCKLTPACQRDEAWCGC